MFDCLFIKNNPIKIKVYRCLKYLHKKPVLDHYFGDYNLNIAQNLYKSALEAYYRYGAQTTHYYYIDKVPDGFIYDKVEEETLILYHRKYKKIYKEYQEKYVCELAYKFWSLACAQNRVALSTLEAINSRYYL